MRGNHAGNGTQIVVDDGLSAESKLLSVGFQAGFYTLIFAADCLELTVFRNLLHLTACRHAVTGHLLKIRIGADAGPVLIGSRCGRVSFGYGCVQGRIDNGHKAAGIGKLTAGMSSHLSPKFIRRHAMCIPDTTAHCTICHQLMQAHAAKALCTRGWFFNRFPHTQKQAVACCSTVFILLIRYHLNMGGQRGSASF